jgi:hypothetical protein
MGDATAANTKSAGDGAGGLGEQLALRARIGWRYRGGYGNPREDQTHAEPFQESKNMPPLVPRQRTPK